MESAENDSACFPPFPQTLEIDKTDSHIPTAAATAGNIFFPKGQNPRARKSTRLQAHLWIGKDCPSTLRPELLDFNGRDAFELLPDRLCLIFGRAFLDRLGGSIDQILGF